MKTNAIKLYFYTWNIDGVQYSSALYVDEQERDAELNVIRNNTLLHDIEFIPTSAEFAISDLQAIINAFNK